MISTDLKYQINHVYLDQLVEEMAAEATEYVATVATIAEELHRLRSPGESPQEEAYATMASLERLKRLLERTPKTRLSMLRSVEEFIDDVRPAVKAEADAFQAARDAYEEDSRTYAAWLIERDRIAAARKAAIEKAKGRMKRRSERGFLIWASRPKPQPRTVAGNDDGLLVPALVMVAVAVVMWWLR